MKIAILTPYPFAVAPSQRFRHEHYLDFLEEQNITYEIFSFFDSETFAILYKPKQYLKKISGVFSGFYRRFKFLFNSKKFDYIYIHREASPIGPPFFEFVLSKILKKKIIYDFDDAIWHSNTSSANKIIASFKFHQKVQNICSWSYKVSVGNEYLKTFASNYNQNVEIIPTVVDMQKTHKGVQNQKVEKVNLGWTGTHSTLKYLDELVSVLQELEKKYDFNFIVISDKGPELPLKSLVFLPWNKTTEIEDLLKFHVGLMPLTQEKWAEGKCGFKAIQYMSLGIPAIVSPVGVNSKIVIHGINGFVASTKQEWLESIETLIQNEALRIEFGKKSILQIRENYSVESSKESFKNLFS